MASPSTATAEPVDLAVSRPRNLADRLDPVVAALALMALILGTLGAVILIRSSPHDGTVRSMPFRRSRRLTTIILGVGVGVAAAALAMAAGPITG